MLSEEILHGESKHLEFKASLPEKSERYMKTMDDTFRINLFRNSYIEENSGSEAKDGANGANQETTNRISDYSQEEKKILNLIGNNPRITQEQLAQETGSSRRTVQRIMKGMEEKGVITRIGATRGYWEIKEKRNGS